MPGTPNSIITPQIPRTSTCVLVSASADIDDAPAASVLLLTAGSSGARVSRISAIPRATVTATMIQLYLSKDGGVTQRLIDSAVIPAFTVTNTTKIPATDFGYSEDNCLLLEANDRIYAASSISLPAGIVLRAEWGDY